MALVLKDRVKETTATTGTGTLTLAGADTGFQSFSVIGDGNTTYYTITDGTDWEVGIGTYTASGTTLSRDTITSSSNSGSAVNWGAGSKDVFVTAPATSIPPDARLAAAWVNWKGDGVVAINNAYNVSSITDLAVGTYLINFTTALPSAYPAIGTFSWDPIMGSGNDLYQLMGHQTYPPTSTSCGVFSKKDDGGTVDVEQNMMVFSA